jgi:hypothetical protein
MNLGVPPGMKQEEATLIISLLLRKLGGEVTLTSNDIRESYEAGGVDFTLAYDPVSMGYRLSTISKT